MEDGVTYRIIVKDQNGVNIHEVGGLVGTSYVVPSSGFPSTSIFGFVSIQSERDGFICSQIIEFKFLYLLILVMT